MAQRNRNRSQPSPTASIDCGAAAHDTDLIMHGLSRTPFVGRWAVDAVSTPRPPEATNYIPAVKAGRTCKPAMTVFAYASSFLCLQAPASSSALGTSAA